VAEVQRACDRLARPTSQPALGAAHYVRAELHRLRGEFAEAEVAYRKANQWGRQPQPGLAQLRLAQGGVDEAHATMRRVLIEAEDDVVTRSRMLGPYVEIALGGGDVAAARGAAEELSRIAAVWSTPFLSALSSHATGSVLLAEGDARAALAACPSRVGGLGRAERAVRRGAFPRADRACLPGTGRRGQRTDGARRRAVGIPATRRGSRPRPRRGTVSDFKADGDLLAEPV